MVTGGQPGDQLEQRALPFRLQRDDPRRVLRTQRTPHTLPRVTDEETTSSEPLLEGDPDRRRMQEGRTLAIGHRRGTTDGTDRLARLIQNPYLRQERVGRISYSRLRLVELDAIAAPGQAGPGFRHENLEASGVVSK